MTAGSHSECLNSTAHQQDSRHTCLVVFVAFYTPNQTVTAGDSVRMAASRQQPVAKGGMWNTPQVNYSKETHSLLKQMMQESKLTNFQQRQLNTVMQGGSSLPTTCNPTSSAKPRPPPSKPVRPKVLNPKNHSAQPRTKEVIEASGAYEREKFIAKAPSTYDKEKKRFVNMMAFGEDLEPPDKSKIVRSPPPPEPYVDRFDELLKEIEERRHFLDDMEAIGKAAQYRSIIETEVSQKIREMEVIDQKRSAELEKRLAREDKKKQQSKLTSEDKQLDNMQTNDR